MAKDLKSYGIQHDADLSEMGLKVRAAPLAEAFKDRLPLSRELQDINEHFGVEIAQAVFATALERLPSYGPFIRRVRAFDLKKTSRLGAEATKLQAAASQFEVTIVESQLPLSGRKWGDHAEEWRAWARTLGFKTDVISTVPGNDIWENAALISSHLLSNPHPRRILITLGQGAAEFRSLLTRRLGVRGADKTSTLTSEASEHAGELDSICLWINVAGAYSGAGITRHWKRSFVSRLAMKAALLITGRKESVVNQIDTKLSAFRAAPNFPRGMKVINLVGFPNRVNLHSSLVLSYHLLSQKIPNDGMVDLYSAIAHPGLILPVVGMTARAETLKLEPILKRVLAAYAEDYAAELSLNNTTKQSTKNSTSETGVSSTNLEVEL